MRLSLSSAISAMPSFHSAIVASSGLIPWVGAFAFLVGVVAPLPDIYSANFVEQEIAENERNSQVVDDNANRSYGMKYTPIIGTLGYILSPDKKQVLMMHRNAYKEDDHFGKYNGLGGKMEKGEDVFTCMTREIEEEASIRVTKMQLRGTINWTCFGPKGEDWLGFIFLIEEFEGSPCKSSAEGALEWCDIDALSGLPMWEGDRYFLPLIFDGDPRPFHGYMPYENSKPLEWSYHR